MKQLIIIVAVSLISACVSTPTSSGGSGLYTIPIGSTVKLNQPLIIPAGQVRAGVQFGRATLSINQYEPHCEFQVNTILETDATLPAGDYLITRVRRYEIPIADLNPGSDKLLASSDEFSA